LFCDENEADPDQGLSPPKGFLGAIATVGNPQQNARGAGASTALALMEQQSMLRANPK